MGPSLRFGTWANFSSSLPSVIVLLPSERKHARLAAYVEAVSEPLARACRAVTVCGTLRGCRNRLAPERSVWVCYRGVRM
jgi:hypothetical protein